MELKRNKPELARKLAGFVPSTTSILGIIQGLPDRDDEVLVQHQNGNYATMLAGSQRSIDTALVLELLNG